MVEGLTTAPVLRDLSHRLGIELPITEGVCRVLEGESLGDLVASLMGTAPAGRVGITAVRRRARSARRAARASARRLRRRQPAGAGEAARRGAGGARSSPRRPRSSSA